MAARALIGLVLALALAGCAGPAATVAPTPAGSEGVDVECAAAMGPLLDALGEIHSRLDIGMTFAEYGQKVGDAKVAYDKLDRKALGLACLDAAGVPAEDALNAYLKAYKTWDACFGNDNCKPDQIEGWLQPDWKAAGDLLDAIEAKLP